MKAISKVPKAIASINLLRFTPSSEARILNRNRKPSTITPYKNANMIEKGINEGIDKPIRTPPIAPT